MKRARIEYQGKIYDNAVVTDEQVLTLPNGDQIGASDVTWLAPKVGTIIALGLNYADHVAELAFKEPPKEPMIFVKAQSGVTAHKTTCYRPDDIEYMHYENELAAIIGKTAHKVKREEAMEYVAGYTIANDYAVRDYLENYYRPNLRVKARDSLLPLGPWIVDKEDIDDHKNLAIRTWVNGELKQEGSTKDMIFDVPFLIEYLSEFMTLQPGDIICTGTPEGVSDMQPGDTVVCEIEGIGKLENYIVSEAEYYGDKY